MMKRILYALPVLFILWLFPQQVFALSCVPRNVKIFLICQNGRCDGFKVEEGADGAPCSFLPYVVDLELGEGDKLLDYLVDTGRWENTDEREQLIVSMPVYCATAVYRDQKSILESCSRDGVDPISVERELADKSLTEWRQQKEAMAQAVREEVRRGEIRFIIGAIFFAALLPLGVIVLLSRVNVTLFRFATLGLLSLQLISFFFLGFVSLFIGWQHSLLGSLLAGILLEAGTLSGMKPGSGETPKSRNLELFSTARSPSLCPGDECAVELSSLSRLAQGREYSISNY